ncbi:unnamed protein product [Paramecium primaurelia]|uniref:Fatty acid hydroxylase domain-containing protein n=1 Tax=Paramecium primaurelia TaxID=5886 RepID=A0A8S1L967_PARPR|nr:unnamed protein product [Paramecium primaurelia]
MLYFIIAILTFTSYFIFVPELLKYYWPEQIESKYWFQILSMQTIHIVVYILVNGSYGIIYYLNHPFFEQFKVEKKPWPWHQNKQEWIKLRNETFKNFSINLIVGILLAMAFGITGVKYRFDRQSLPDLWEMIPQFLFCILIEDIGFYWSHRLLHIPALYKYHKQHHQYTVTISISAEYSTALEYLLSNLLPFIIGPRLLNERLHMMTMLIWIGIRVYKTLSAHSGYVFPWEIFQYIPFLAFAEFHSYHHSHNDGNYGSFFVFWDYLFGTSNNYYQNKLKDNYGILNIYNPLKSKMK